MKIQITITDADDNTLVLASSDLVGSDHGTGWTSFIKPRRDQINRLTTMGAERVAELCAVMLGDQLPVAGDTVAAKMRDAYRQVPKA